jgi:hypothetical protein
MGVVDTDFASDPETVMPEELSDGLEERRINAGVGEKAKMAIGIEWRSPDVSNLLITRVIDAHLSLKVCCLSPLAVVQGLQRQGYGQWI